MQLKIYKSFDRELESIWVEFEKTAIGTPFQYYNWLSHWQATVGRPLYSIEPYIITVKNNEQVLAIIPLGIRRSMGISILEWIGGINADYMGFLFHSEWIWKYNDFHKLWKEILDNLPAFDLIHLQRQLNKIRGFDNPFANQFTRPHNTKSYQTTLEPSWDNHYQTRLKKKIRADSRRQRHRLEQLGQLQFLVAEKRKQKSEIIKVMMQQKSHRYQDTGVWNMLAVPEYQKFYIGLANLNYDHNKVHCSALLVDKIMIATHVGLVDRDTFYYTMPAHKGGDWKRFSSGRLLLENLMEWSIENNLKYFDFTVGEELYKKIWCDTETQLFETLQSITLKGRIYILSEYLKRHIKQIPWVVQKHRAIKNWIQLSIK